MHCWWECKLVQPLWKKIWRLVKNLNIDLPYDPAIPLLGKYPKLCDIGYSRNIFTLMFIAALFTTAKKWKQPKCPSTDEWVEKMWYLYTMKFYAALKKNEISSFASTWIELERLARPRRPKSTCSPSYADFKSRVNTTRELDFDHMIRRGHTRDVCG
jgi:hypothetical protein